MKKMLMTWMCAMALMVAGESSFLHAQWSVFSQNTHGEVAEWLNKYKCQSPFLIYIPEFYDENIRINMEQREQSTSPIDLSRLQVDMQGTMTHSRFNFTDLVHRYNDVDSWMEFKVSYWLDEKKTISPFFSYVPTFTSNKKFEFQNYQEFRYGLQWYPFPENSTYPFLKSVRAFAQYASRDLYDMANKQYVSDPTLGLSPEEEAAVRRDFEAFNQLPKSHDVQVGLDYYYDNIFGGQPMAFSIWSSLAWYKTNFSVLNFYEKQNYNAVISKGNVKYGPAKKWRESLLFPYVVVDWAYSPRYEERWTENFLRTGVGMRFYPLAFAGDEETKPMWKNLMKRFHIFSEFLYNAAWLGDEPKTSVRDTDFRVGFGYSTSGYFREKA